MAGVADPIVAIENLTFQYRRASEPALHDLSMAVHPGEVILVAGPSGCGKSTLIRAINGLIPHAYPGELTGSVRVGGLATTEQKLRDISLHVGTVLQDPARQIVGATVEAELAFGPHGTSKVREAHESQCAPEGTTLHPAGAGSYLPAIETRVTSKRKGVLGGIGPWPDAP